MVKILLIEDNSTDAFIAEKVVMLSGANVHLDVVENGAKALAHLTTQYLETGELPDILLMDLYMPEQDGLQFLTAFSALDMLEKNKIQLLMLTNSIDLHVRTEALQLGMQDVFIKPLSVSMLNHIVVQHTHRTAVPATSFSI
jgi:CheY-like chemotaxis protein